MDSREQGSSADATGAAEGSFGLHGVEGQAASPDLTAAETNAGRGLGDPAKASQMSIGQVRRHVTITVEGKEHPFLTHRLLDIGRDLALHGIDATISAHGLTVAVTRS
jgi:hypothetical protein